MAESHDVSQMVLTVYDPKGQSVTNPLELSLENVDVSDGASVDFARYQIAKKDEDSGLTKDYQNVYGTVKLNNSSNSIDTSQNTTQEFSASILISDSAKVYNPSSTDENPNVGNTTTVVYLSSEVYAKTLGSVSADELIACVNGTYKEVTSLGDETATSILTTLFGDGNSNGGAKNTMENSAKLHFSLNPGARPTYEISSLNNLSQANVIDSITNASSLSSIIASSAISASVSASNESKNNINVSSLKMVYYNLGKFSTSLTSIIKSLSSIYELNSLSLSSSFTSTILASLVFLNLIL